MYPNTKSGIKLKVFVRENEGSEQKPQSKHNVNKYMRVKPLTGEKAKEFYESIIGKVFSPKEIKTLSHMSQKEQTKSQQTSQKSFKDVELLKMAQNNDVKNLKTFFSQGKGFDVDIVDEFGWTPLMCAACSGAEEAVKMLLENQADPSKCDRLGNTALTLAKQKNHTRVISILETLHKTKKESEEDVNKGIVQFFCKVCRENVAMNEKKHESSTLHLFNCQLKTSTFYGIPENNRGFQLLLKKGWDKEKGLGPAGTGRKFPIKSVVKNDRTGIGASPPRASKCRADSKHTLKYENKRLKSYKQGKNKNFEKNFRLEFS